MYHRLLIGWTYVKREAFGDNCTQADDQHAPPTPILSKPHSDAVSRGVTSSSKKARQRKRLIKAVPAAASGPASKPGLPQVQRGASLTLRRRQRC